MLEDDIVCGRATVARRLISVLGFALAITGIGCVGAARADAVSDAQMANVYASAAQNGNDVAEYYLAALYASGVGVPQSDAVAVAWFERAANHGHAHAMLILSGLLAIGRGTPRDYVASYKWAYIVSVASRTDEYRDGAKQLLGLIEPRMTPEQIAQAKSQAMSFRASSASPSSQASAPAPTNPTIPPLPAPVRQ